ncbi:hypothetical protein ZIOFF_030337 [Zingiber officinale]|uniref:RING-type domain-containing protein n=1 Tax=Zingiber officinale TaxID=94328 RepID=A0A8J5GXZ1_ZINOF|nr:hypothetical protein ZIOFF_030337 [Zingiber officinale]
MGAKCAKGFSQETDSRSYAQSRQVTQYRNSNSNHHSAPAAVRSNDPRPRIERRYSRISDNYETLEQVTEALAESGLESSNLIVGIDFTKSNEWTGKFSFGGRSLHHIGDTTPNPYEQAISIIGRTLSAFDEDNLIPCFGFGDGPTSFAPIIEMAMTIVEQTGGQYHVLLIIADGQVTRSVDTQFGHFGSQEQKTIDAIVRASEFPLSIILVGVGDGPWDMMKEFDDNIPARSYDNFQFVNFTEIMAKNIPLARKEAAFSLAALMEIPSQYKATIDMGILGCRTGKSPRRVPLLPPTGSQSKSSFGYDSSKSSNFHQSSSPYSGYRAETSARTAPTSAFEIEICPICLSNPKDMVFGCGHQTCSACGQSLQSCPLCRTEIQTRIKLY